RTQPVHPSPSSSRVLVTGAASGIGLAVALRCLSQGAEVAALDRDGPGLRRAFAGLAGAEQARVAVTEADISDPAEVRAALAGTAGADGTLGAVVNAAGIGGYTGDIGQTTLEEWGRTLAVNLSGTFHVCREALPFLRAGGGGRI